MAFDPKKPVRDLLAYQSKWEALAARSGDEIGCVKLTFEGGRVVSYENAAPIVWDADDE